MNAHEGIEATTLLPVLTDPLERQLERELATFLQEEYVAHGDDVDQWYRLRFIPKNIGLAPYDIAIADFVTRHCASFGAFIEIGAGIGQQSMLLALRQRRVWAIEGQTEYLPMAARALARVTERVYPALPRYFTLYSEWFPRRAEQYVQPDSVLCFPTLGSTQTAEEERQVFEAIGKSSAVIFNVRDFFRLREDAAEQRTLIERFRQYDFEEPVEVYAWDKVQMGFHPNRVLFMRKRLRRRFRLRF